MFMRTAIAGLALVALAGCGDQAAAPSGSAAPVACEVLPGLTLDMPAGWKMSSKDGMTDIEAAVEHCHMQLWAVADAAAPADVLPRIAELVKAEVRDFKPAETRDLTLAGAPAKHVIGAGVEADDNDVSKVEVFVFTAGGKAWLLCAHTGEDDPAKQRDEIVKLLDTAKAK